MPNQYINKVIYGGILISGSNLLTNGTIILHSTCKFVATDIRGLTRQNFSGSSSCIRRIYVKCTSALNLGATLIMSLGSQKKLTGFHGITGKVNQGSATIPQGFHDGSGKVGIDTTEKGKLVANNIREGVTILGIEGTMSGSENMKPQAKTVTPSTAKQTILPDAEYNCLSQVEVEAIPYVEADNPAGGVTVTIAG